MNSKTILFAAAFGLASQAAMAACASQTYGNQTFTNCAGGEHYNSMQFGNQTFTSGVDARGNATNGSTMQFGNQRFYNGPMYNNGR